MEPKGQETQRSQETQKGQETMADARFERIVSELPGCDPQRGTVTPLSGGITNQNYRVDGDEVSYVIRVCGANTEHLGIDRDNERACTQVAADLGIGPAVVHFDADAMILVTRFVEGKTLTAEMARKSGALERIIATVKRYHEGPAFPGSFSPFETVRTYHRIALDRDVDFPAEIDDAFARMGDIETALAQVSATVPCHNDLLAGNFIDDGERIWVVDWEYAGMGDPYFDLGNFAVNQKLDDSGCETVVRLYTRETRDADLAHLHLMRVASDLRESFWGFLQSGISTLDFDYLDYAKKHLGRFLDNASKARFNANLRAVSK